MGGWLFGHLADSYGRRNALMLSVLLMCFGSLMIAVTPTYATIGLAAPVVLGLARCIQGLSLGGEYGTSATYLTEVADEKHRGFYSSFQYVTLIGGQLTALLVLLLLQQVFLTAEQLKSVGLAHPVRDRRAAGDHRARHAAQPARDRRFQGGEAQVVKRESSIKALTRYPREVLLVVGLTMGGTTAFYTYTTYMQKYLKLSVGLTDNQTTLVTAGSLIFALILQPIYGALSDRIGRKPLLIWFGVTGTLFTIPLLNALQIDEERASSRSCSLQPPG
ncbi:MAG: MFS transporter [Vicinamibacterales bacterium]